MIKLDKEAIEAGLTGGEKTTTGYAELDRNLGGLKRGETYLLASRPSMGKTALALNILRHVALEQDKTVAYFSLDEGMGAIIKKLLSMQAKVESRDLSSDEPEVMARINNAKEEFSRADIYIEDEPNLSVPEISEEVMSIGKKVDLIIVDCLQDVKENFGQYNVSAAVNCASFRNIAKDFNCPVLILSQMSRKPDERKEHRPRMSDLYPDYLQREVDNILLLYRDEYYKPDTMERNVAELCIAKCKSGAVGMVRLVWLPELQLFSSLILMED